MQVVAGQSEQQQQPPPQQQQQEVLPPITQSREELMGAPVKELKRMLQDRKIDTTGAAAGAVESACHVVVSSCLCGWLWHAAGIAMSNDSLCLTAGVAEKGELVQLIQDRCKGVSYYK